jgi:hypothetical protein
MRISCVNTDPGYSLESGEHSVTLDGRLVWFCQTADEEEGFVDTFLVHGNVCFGVGGFSAPLDVSLTTMKPVVRRTQGKVRIYQCSLQDQIKHLAERKALPVADSLYETLSCEMTAEHRDALKRIWENQKWELPRIEAVESDMSFHTIPKEGFTLVVLRDPNVTQKQLDYMARALRAKAPNAMLVCIPDGDIETLDERATTYLMRAAAAKLSDEALAEAGLARLKPKSDIFDINRRFA